MSSKQATLISDIASCAAESIKQTVIADLTALTETLSGDDSGLTNTWEEICVQVRGEESFFWDAYQEVMRDSVRGELTKLSSPMLSALWLQTESGWDWHDEFAYVERTVPQAERPATEPGIPYDIDAIAEWLVQEHLIPAAERYSNRRIDAFLSSGLDDDWELDDEDTDEDGEDEDAQDVESMLEQQGEDRRSNSDAVMSGASNAENQGFQDAIKGLGALFGNPPNTK